jgi:hypothetical protein
MQYGSVNIDGNQLYATGNTSPIDVNNIEYMYVKQLDKASKAQKAALIGAVISAIVFVIIPLLGLVVFPLVAVPIYLRSCDYELRVFVTNNTGFGAKEVSLHSSNHRDEYDKVIEHVKALKQS